MKTKLTIFLFYLSTSLFAQVGQWEWAKLHNNIYYYDTLLFAPRQVRDTNKNLYYIGNTSTNCVLAKVDKFWNKIWEYNWKGGNLDGHSITLKDSVLYVTGTFKDTLTLGTHIYPYLAQRYSLYAFVACLNLTGKVVWIKIIKNAGPFQFSPRKMVVDKNHNLYIAAYISDSVKIDSVNISPFNGNYATFLRFDNKGNLTWMKQMGKCTSSPTIGADDSGNIYTAFTFCDTLLIGGNTFVSDGGYYTSGDLCIGKFNSTGNLLWAKKAGQKSREDVIDDMLVTSYGDIYLAGNLADTIINFGTVSLNDFNLNYTPMYIVKYDTYGECKWGLKSTGNKGICKKHVLANIFAKGAPGVIYIQGYLTDYNNPIDSIYNVFGKDTIHTVSVSTSTVIAKISENNNVGISEVLDRVNITIFPNPSSGIFSINLNKTNVEANISLYDVLGNCLWKKGYRNDLSSVIDLTSQAKGIYFVEIMSGSESVVRKIVLQ